MVEVKVCVGSSCFLKHAPDIVEYINKKIETEDLWDKIILSGSFCAGKCNRIGVTIFVNDQVYTGVTVDGIEKFWNEKIVPYLN
ncbi:MAG: (2Fe-2S) ferredoxin domain-containing protein [Acholeplasmatales bacterium]|nr:(2Fe-2S) ferredoxin domain-containing protein [Acholeplasmatales bacterium]MDY4016627.1 (2Fe-2S) ferredoxin domain-containing protein [Bacilli bacterium]